MGSEHCGDHWCEVTRIQEVRTVIDDGVAVHLLPEQACGCMCSACTRIAEMLGVRPRPTTGTQGTWPWR